MIRYEDVQTLMEELANVIRPQDLDKHMLTECRVGSGCGSGCGIGIWE